MCGRYLLEPVVGAHTHLDLGTPPSDDDQAPGSHASSQTVVGSSTDPNTGDRTSSKRRRDTSPSDSARSPRPFVAGSPGDSLPQYLTVGPATLISFSHVKHECRFLRAGRLFCSKPRFILVYSGKLILSRQGYTWGVLWELVRLHRLDSSQAITPAACRSLIGVNVAVGPNVRAILLGTRTEGSPVPDLGKAERDAQVRVYRLRCVSSRLMVASLHGNILTLRRS